MQVAEEDLHRRDDRTTIHIDIENIFLTPSLSLVAS